MSGQESKCFFHNRMDYGFMTDYRPNYDVVKSVASNASKSVPQMTSWELKQHIKKNAENIIQSQFKNAYHNCC